MKQQTITVPTDLICQTTTHLYHRRSDIKRFARHQVKGKTGFFQYFDLHLNKRHFDIPGYCDNPIVSYLTRHGKNDYYQSKRNENEKGFQKRPITGKHNLLSEYKGEKIISSFFENKNYGYSRHKNCGNNVFREVTSFFKKMSVTILYILHR